jgi:HK97 family phage portal protein
VKALVRRAAGRAAGGAKQVDVPGQNAGWRGVDSLSSYYRAGPARVGNLLRTYGGTEESSSWVFSCVSFISDRLAASDWTLHDLRTSELVDDLPTLDEDLNTVLDPMEHGELTYFDRTAYIGMDLEIAGNSYWLMDERNMLGQPLRLRRFRPELVQIATDQAGRLIGYVLHVKGRQIPYDPDEVLHFKYPNPLDEHYGMGTVEAIVREVNADLAASEHVTGFYSSGGRVSGVLTVNGTMGETQFNRLKAQLQGEFIGTQEFAVAVVEQATKFEPLQQAPADAGVVDISNLTKDRILSGFGLPEFVLGGRAQGGVYKMEEAQNIVMQTMEPKARRYGERMTILTSLWGYEFRAHPSTVEPRSTRIERGRNMLGAGASVNESRREMGLDEIDDPIADAVVLPTGLAPVGILAPRKGVRTRGGRVKPPVLKVPNELAGQKALEGPGAHPGYLAEGLGELGTDRTMQLPELPEGFERRALVKVPTEADPQAVAELVQHHALMVRRIYDQLRPVVLAFFSDQQGRVLDRLNGYRSAARRGSWAVDWKALDDPNALWDDPVENEALLAVYLPVVDAVGPAVVETPARLAGAAGLSWDLTNPFIRAARDRIADLVVRINDTTRSAIAEQVEEGMRRGYSIPQLANGVPDEDFPGVRGVFSQASAVRAETIARSETAMVYNAGSTASYRAGGLERALVLDGNGDGACADANGQVWPLDRCEAESIEHPNCVRAFAPVL